MKLEHPHPPATDGEIAAINLESARLAAWARFARDPRRPGVAEEIVDEERLASQFLGDVAALDRMEALATQFADIDDSFRAPLIQAEVASAAHRFGDARRALARAAAMDGPHEAIERQSLAVDQACGVDLDVVLSARCRIAAASGRLEDLVPLGALFADLKSFTMADGIYRDALHAYEGASPFPPAWVCFQLGMLWGELVPTPDPDRAALWYRCALAYLPGYVNARVHLAEIHASQSRTSEAVALLVPLLSSGDPEVPWHLADMLLAQGRLVEAEKALHAARSGFEDLLQKHFLAFADHAAEFYAGSGNDCRRALELARANVANRPTRHAIKQAHAIALNAAHGADRQARRRASLTPISEVVVENSAKR